jgi:citrate lyase beta subunit
LEGKELRHHQYNPDFNFFKEPAQFDKYSNKKLLQFCLGATLYTPGTKDIKKALCDKNKLPGLTSLVLDCEDAISASDLTSAEANIIDTLEYIINELENGKLNQADLPLLFIRLRNIEQFKNFSKRLSAQHLEILSGFNFPKFDTSNGGEYLTQLENLNNKNSQKLYGMPILESEELAYREKRVQDLKEIENILKPYKELILNIRVGATDFSSLFALRRGIDFTVYDLAAVKECLADIINYFNRAEGGYVISGPVWEYFSTAGYLNLHEVKTDGFYQRILNHKVLVNKAVDGLLKEVILDKTNGFIGKTIIHPSQIKYVNALQAVTEEEYNDAQQIIASDAGGVVKSLSGNKMNEINPHRSWAERIICRAEAYGVIKDQSEYLKLIFK